MASIKSLRTLYAPLSAASPTVSARLPSTPLGSRPGSQSVELIRTGTVLPPSVRPSASTGNPYDGAGTGRRMMEWQPTRLGPTTSLWGTLDLLRARSRDAVRNNPWAASAIDNFESQAIGTGIKPKWNIEDERVKNAIEKEFNRWALNLTCDAAGLLNFYGLQALAAREIFEAGEVLSRFCVRPASWNLRVGLQIQLIEAEQLPVFQNMPAGSIGPEGMPIGNTVRTGIEFDQYNRRVAYQLYREHPGELMFYPTGGLEFIRVPADEMLHVYKPLRVGQLRGQPFLTSVLAKLYELDKYTDAAVVKKQIQTMFAGFITKTDPYADTIPSDSVGTIQPGNPQTSYDPGVANAKLETGTLFNLLPGEQITFPTLPQDNDLEGFMRQALHEFAAGIGATYEQITGDLKGVTYSSIRAGLLDFRRKCEQFQYNIIVRQFCHPIVCRWLFEAYMAGVIDLPGYRNDSGIYEDITWSTPGWAWVDPLKDVQAAVMEIRSGLNSREKVVAEGGQDVATVDAQQAADNKRADSYGLIYDSDPRRILLKGSTVDDGSGENTDDGQPAGGEGQSGPSKPGKTPKK